MSVFQPYLDRARLYAPIAGEFLYDNMGGACFEEWRSCLPPKPIDFCSRLTSVNLVIGIMGIFLGGKGSPLGFGAFLASRIGRMVEAHHCFIGAEINKNEKASSLASMAFIAFSGLSPAEITETDFVERRDVNPQEAVRAFLELDGRLGPTLTIGQLPTPKDAHVWQPPRKITELSLLPTISLRYRILSIVTKTVLGSLCLGTLFQEQRAANAAYQQINASLAKP